MKVSPFNPPTHNLDPFYARQLKSFKVSFRYTDHIGCLKSSTLYLQAPTVRAIKRRIYSTIQNVHSLSIVPVTVKK